MKILLLLSLGTLAVLAVQRVFFSFGAQSPEDYADTAPPFDIRIALNGAMISEGVIYGPTGRVDARFVARMQGNWANDGTGTLAESFSYATGGTQERKWFLTMGENGHFTATASDIIGTATGQQVGSTVRMKYRIKLDEDAGGHVLDVTDWLYLMENGSIMNRSEMRKFGIKVAELVASIRPDDT
ncbi:MAG: DUF3833 family protein [Brevirhabdus sp.]